MQQSGTALDTLASDELGIYPKELGGSAWGAAITSFFLFAIGAIIPVFPFLFANGLAAVVVSLALSVLGLFGIGAGVSLTAGSPLWKAGVRQVFLSLLAAGITFGLGKLIGSAIGKEYSSGMNKGEGPREDAQNMICADWLCKRRFQTSGFTSSPIMRDYDGGSFYVGGHPPVRSPPAFYVQLLH